MWVTEMRSRVGCLAALALSTACAQQALHVTPTPDPGVLDSLRPGSTLRLRAGPDILTGQLVRLTGDSLVLAHPHTTSLARTAVDTVWRRPPHSSRGLQAGLLFGVVMAGLIVASGRSTDEPALSTRVAIAVGLGAALLGAVFSSLGQGWELIYWR
jgi:hypothetical protein